VPKFKVKLIRKMNFQDIKKQAQKQIEKAENIKELDQVFKQYLGKKGQVSLMLKQLKTASEDEKKKLGKQLNELKQFISNEIQKKKDLNKESDSSEWIDISVPGKKPVKGGLHILTQTKREIMDIFYSMGFEVLEGPEIETEWYNFDALNIPKDHPARDGWDTLWLKTDPRLLLRTHTSPVQARYMEQNKPPLRIIVPGRCYRHEATDASHDFQFHQVEGLMVDKGISIANFKSLIQEFFKSFFKDKDLKIRLKPDYFPFTEPSFDIAVSCTVCKGKGCPTCKKTGWLELGGAGIVNPNVYKYCGLDPKGLQGWAFGFGLERLAMMKHKINDIRLFNSGDFRFLNQF